MATYGLPVLYALFIWWFSTGAVLYVIGLPQRTYRWSMAAATAVAAVALVALSGVSGETTTASAYAAFTCALLVWGWHEMSFLTGYVTGPRTSECPRHDGARAQLGPAVETLLYHEVAILLTGMLLYALVGESINALGWWTFAVLWIMRLSAKFNVYLGVPNLTEEFLPPHLAYLKSYFAHRPMNWLFPVSVTASTAATVLLVQAASAADATAFEATSFTFLATLMGLAVIEHWFLVVPVPAAALWNWGLSSRERHQASDRHLQRASRSEDVQAAERPAAATPVPA